MPAAHRNRSVRPAPARRLVRAARLALPLVLLSALLSGCWVLTPALPPVAPPPNLPTGAVLAQLDPGVVAGWERPNVLRDRDRNMAALTEADPVMAEHVANHRVVLGMESRHVVWSLLAHPTRVVDQGPPGGHTLCWEPGRYWVRLDQTGHVVGAGRY